MPGRVYTSFSMWYTSDEVILMSENKIPLRQDADKKYMWHTEDLFLTDEVWEEKYKELEKKAPLVENFRDSMTRSGEELFKALSFFNELAEELDRIYVYAYMKFHEDSTNSKLSLIHI